jgi:hypothetical protein
MGVSSHSIAVSENGWPMNCAPQPEQNWFETRL